MEGSWYQATFFYESAADLIGFPVRVVVGAKGLANGGVEIKRRCDDKSKMQIVAPDAALEAIKAALEGE